MLNIVHGVLFGIGTMTQQQMFDQAERLVNGQTVFSAVMWALLLYGGIKVLREIVNGTANYIPDILFTKIEGKLSYEIHQKMAKLSPVVFEDTQKLDDINKAEQGKKAAPWFVFVFTLVFTFYIPYFIFMGWYLFSLKPVLAAAILLVFFPTVGAQIIRVKTFTDLEKDSAPVRRRYEYYEECITKREYYKETRLLGGFFYFRRLFLEMLDLLQKLRWRAMVKTSLVEFLTRMLTVIGYCGILYLLFDGLMNQEISVGAFAAVFNSIGLMYDIMDEVICGHITRMSEDLGAIRNYMDFMNMEERTGTVKTLPEWGDIVLEDVSFAYPGADKNAVNHATLTLKKGETLAVVGENGSGKSTLMRLISGLYLPCQGDVTINGVSTRDLSPEALYTDTSAVFQKYRSYQMTLKDNITISDLRKQGEKEQLDEVCEMAGVNLEDRSFTQGYQTMLSREFDGVDLSGGQWQRIAIARGFFRTHNLIILDEPTAAIDPYEETRIYNRFAEISKDKSAVIVTHRLGSVKLADHIVVMKDGNVCQIGTHEELISQTGEYARLYKAQEQWYRDESC